SRPLEGKERSFPAAGHARFDAAVPLRRHGAARAVALAGMVRRPLEAGMGRHGAVREQARGAVRAVQHRADWPCLRARLCRFPLCRLRLAQGLSEARRLPSEDAGAAVGENLGAAAGVTTETETGSMREGGKRLQRLGLAAL